MNKRNDFDVIIIGGSYAGLSAGLSLGRASRDVLIIDGGKPCNRQTPRSHNFITQDGVSPGEIARQARAQIQTYDTVTFYEGTAEGGAKTPDGFEIRTGAGDAFRARKLLFATGVTDQMPNIKGFADCWGISVLHCPYCHGYEVKNETIGLLGNGDAGFQFCKMLSNWTEDLTLYTNGKSTLTNEQSQKLAARGIQIVEQEIVEFEHSQGKIRNIRFADGGKARLSAVFAKIGFKQHCDIPHLMDCGINEQGHIQVDDFGQTSVPGVFAAGDSTPIYRAVSLATASGTKAGAFINQELINDYF